MYNLYKYFKIMTTPHSTYFHIIIQCKIKSFFCLHFGQVIFIFQPVRGQVSEKSICQPLCEECSKEGKAW